MAFNFPWQKVFYLNRFSQTFELYHIFVFWAISGIVATVKWALNVVFAIIVFACDALCTPCYAMSAIFNTVSLHSTAFGYCTVRYGTGGVGRYGQRYTYLNSIAFSNVLLVPKELLPLSRCLRLVVVFTSDSRPESSETEPIRPFSGTPCRLVSFSLTPCRLGTGGLPRPVEVLTFRMPQEKKLIFQAVENRKVTVFLM